jgi:ankyrin repeat protein
MAPCVLKEVVDRNDVEASWLDGGWRVDTLFTDGRSSTSALLYASSQGRSQIVDLLLAQKASVDLQSSFGETGLMCACCGHAPVVRRLLTAGAQTGLRNRDGHSAMDLASLTSRAEQAACVEALREYARLWDAASAGTTVEVATWLEGGGHVDALRGACCTTMLMTASSGGHASLVDLLLEHTACLDLQDSAGNTALMTAAVNSHAAVLGRLLKAGANTGLRNGKEATALDLVEGERCESLLENHYAALVAKRCMAEEEAEARGDPQDPSKVSVRIMEAVINDDEAAVVAWLESGGQVDALWEDPDGSSEGSTLLMQATRVGHEHLVDLLLERKAGIDLQNSLTHTALMYAAVHNKAVVPAVT